jgi:predicted dehydrogenase
MNSSDNAPRAPFDHGAGHGFDQGLGNVFGIGIVGTGIMGRRMMDALQAHPRWHIAALWDPRTDAAGAASLAAGGVPCAASLQALVSDPAVQAVYIASPPAHHREGVQAVLAAGRACLCEKPLAHTVAEAQALHDEVVASGLPFAVNFPFARSAAVQRLTDLVRGGALGPLQQATLTVRFARWPREWQAGAGDWLAGPEQGGFTREVLSHFVFLALRLFGPATVQVEALDRAPGAAETRLQARLVHEHLTLHVDAAVGGDEADHNRFEVIGAQDRVALTGWSRLEHRGRSSEPVVSLPATLDALAARLQGRTDTGLATVGEALAVVRCVEALLAGRGGTAAPAPSPGVQA